MITLLQYYWRLCLMQVSPANAPTAPWFVITLVALNVTLATALTPYLDPEQKTLTTLNSALIQNASVAALLWLSLNLRNLNQRFMATLTAWLGCDLIISLIFSAFLPILLVASDTAPAMAALAFFVWTLSAVGHVTHRAMDIGITAGILIAFGIILFGTFLSRALLT